MSIKSLLTGILYFCCVHAAAQIGEKTAVADGTVKITAPTATVLDWFHLIEKNGIILSYNSSYLDLNKRCTVNEVVTSIRNLLQTILDDYKFKIIPTENNKLILQIEGKKVFGISGIVRESVTGERLYGAMVVFRDRNQKLRYSTSNDDGLFFMNLNPGTYSVEVQYMGFVPYKREINISNDRKLSVEMIPDVYEIKEVTVRPGSSWNELNEASPSNMLSFSHSDFFSQINILPGVTGTIAGGNFQVNGGGSDENMILLDGIQIYHPSHINPMLSVFNGDAIKNVAFYKNFFPTEYEGRLSSITDVRFRDGSKQKHMQSLTLDMPAASAVLEGPIIKNKLSYMIGGRHSWMDLFDGMTSVENRLNHSFNDWNAKLSYEISDRTSLQLMGYRTSDNYKADMSEEAKSARTVLKWKNELYALKFNTVWGKKLINTNTLTYSSYDNSVYAPAIGYDMDKFIHGGIKGFSFSSDFSYDVYDIYTVKAGFKLSHEQFDIVTAGDSLGGVRNLVDIDQFSFFYDNKVRLTDNLYTQFGINFVGYLPRKEKYFYSMQPRFSLKYAVDEKNLLFVGISKMEQFYHSIRIDIMPMPTDFRMPSIKGFIPSTSEHYELGWKRFFPNGYMESSFFYKHRNNIVAIRPEALDNGNSWKRYVMSGKGNSYGFKFFFYNDWKKMTAQLSYTYSRSLDRYDDMKEKGWVPSLYDIPHSCHLALTYKITPFMGFSLGSLLQSGRIRDMDDDYIYYTAGDFRNHRRNFTYRIDAAYNYVKDFNKDGMKLMFRIGLYNIMGNPTEEDVMNMYSVNWGRHCLPFGCISFKF